MEKYAAIILAAGKGTRMNEGSESPIPKVMFEVAGKPIIRYAVDAFKNAGIQKIVLIVGYKKEIVIDYFKDEVEYAVQVEQLGTGHAAMCAENNLKGKVESIIISNGDHALYKPETIEKLIAYYESENPTIAMLSVIFKDPMHWAFGRIIRDENNQVQSIIEQKDCNKHQLEIKETNPNFYIIDANWFWENVKKITTDNAQKEFYITDIIKIAKNQNKKIIALPVSEEEEAYGINTPEQLREAEEIINNRD